MDGVRNHKKITWETSLCKPQLVLSSLHVHHPCSLELNSTPGLQQFPKLFSSTLPNFFSNTPEDLSDRETNPQKKEELAPW